MAKPPKPDSSVRGQALIFIVISVVFLGALALAGTTARKSDNENPKEQIAIPVVKNNKSEKKNLQIDTIEFITNTPTPPSIQTPPDKVCDGMTIGMGEVIKKANAPACCYYHIYTDDCSTCCNGVCVDKDAPQRIAINPKNPPPPDATYWCDAKPVIYLYPTQKTKVTVKVKVPGRIIKSIPLYDEASGWENVLAYPDGKLVYKGEEHKELFYETLQTKTPAPENGDIVKKSELKRRLTSITTSLGLNNFEQKEFLEYWVPRLEELKSPYVLVSVFSPTQKEILDKVFITPKPDTFINFIMYYKEVYKPYGLPPLTLPKSIPKRVGFTAVEWGGIVDEN